jgi:ferric-dicitrate binding protein FerR (iron transport regulator)
VIILDAVEELEATLERARAEHARALDRVEALVELMGLALEARDRLGVSMLTFDDLSTSRRNEIERAELAALCGRAGGITITEGAK